MRFLFTLVTAVFLGNIAAAATVGDDGLHIQSWIRDTFKDLQEDLDEANAEGKRLAIMFEQRGCIYCKEMHETVYTDPELAGYIDDNFFVVRLNLHGDLEVVDFDGDTLSEKKTSRKWGILFTPSIIFMPENVEDGQSAIQASVAMMPGAFSRGMTLDMFTWVNEKRYALDSDEDFQRYHARRINERRAAKE
jgi:thioredoxin-related protein